MTEPRRWHYEAAIESTHATPEGALGATAASLREQLLDYNCRANATDELLMVRITVVSPTEVEANDTAFHLIENALENAGPDWTKRRWVRTRVTPA